MKKLKTLLVLALMGLATSASAQLVTSSSFSSSSSGSSIWTAVNTDGYNRIYVSYLPSKLDLLGVFDFKMNGSVQAGYLRGISLTRKVPLYLEVGGAVQYRKGKLSQESASVKINALSVNIPVSLAYRVNVTDEWAISPNFGFDFRVNATGKLKASDGVDESSYDLFDDGAPSASRPAGTSACASTTAPCTLAWTMGRTLMTSCWPLRLRPLPSPWAGTSDALLFSAPCLSRPFGRQAGGLRFCPLFP